MNDKSRCRWILCISLVLFLGGVAGGETGASAIPATQEPALLWSIPTGCTEWCGDDAGKVSCSYDGEQVALGYGAGTLELRNRKGDITGRWQSPHGYYKVWSVAISRDGSRTVVVLNDPMQEHEAEVVYLDEHGKLIWQNPLGTPFGFADIADDGSVVAVTEGDRISFYNRTGNRTGTKMLEGMIWSMQLAGDGSYAVAGVTARDYSGNLYVIGNNGTVEWFSTTRREQNTVAVSGNGEYLAGADSNQLRFFAHNGSQGWKYNSSIEIRSLAISSGGDYVAAGSQYYLRYFNRTGRILWQHEDPGIMTRSGASFSHVTITDNGEYVAATTRGNKTLLFNDKGKILNEFGSRSWVSDMCMPGGGNALVIATRQEIQYFDTGIPPLPDTKPHTVIPQQLPEETTLPAPTQKAPASVLNIGLGLLIIILMTKKPGTGRE
jgi:hypothetical protein